MEGSSGRSVRRVSTDPSTSLISVAVAVPTFRRPELLRSCLGSVLEQEFAGCLVHVLVIDNDPAGSARSVAFDLAERFPGRVNYLREAERGLAAVRNRALAEVEGYDFLAFIDDDERAQPNWLGRLLCAADEFGAAVINGSVLSDLESGGPTWVAHSRLFRRQLPKRGTLLPFCAANNVLLRVAEVGRTGVRFDPKFGATGGEDTDFFMRLHDAGLAIVSEPAAEVAEFVPLNRQTVAWIFGRYVRTAGLWVRIRQMRLSWYDLWPNRLVSATGHLVFGICSFFLIPFRFGKNFDRTLWHFGQFMGTLLGLAGYVKPTYGRQHK